MRVSVNVYIMHNMYIFLHRELGRRVRDAMKKAKYSLSVAINRLAQSYSMLILAIGLDDQHHSMRGRYADIYIHLHVSDEHVILFIHVCINSQLRMLLIVIWITITYQLVCN